MLMPCVIGDLGPFIKKQMYQRKRTMLKQRVITGILYIISVFAVIFVLPSLAVSLVFFCLCLGCFMEWTRLARLPKPWQKMACWILFTLLSCLMFLFPSTHFPLLIFGCILWVAITGWLMWCIRQHAITVLSPAVMTTLGFMTLLPMFAGLLTLDALPQGPYWLLMLFLLVWCSDTGAYCVGRLIGRHKMAPLITPGKTIEGLIGGIVMTCLALWAYYHYVLHHPFSLISFMLVADAVMLAVVGDLFESALKRIGGVKDSGTLLPGHGGLLDRFDSLIALTPGLALMITLGVL
jgi:phosphatidate cytidylyltransferase